MTITGEQALARVRAVLGRDPQDRYEAAIALESSGLTGARALELGRRAIRLASGPERVPPPPPPDRHRPRWNNPTSVGLLLVALVWASMITAGGNDQRPYGVLLGLPLGLTLVGYLDRRYMAGENGPTHLRSDAGAVAILIIVPCLVLLAISPRGPIAVGVVLMLISSTIATRLGLALPVIAILLAAFVGSRLGLPSNTMAVVALGAVVVVIIADLARLPRMSAPPARLQFALTRGLAGFGVGLFSVPVLAHAATSTVVLVVPSAVGGALAGSFLHRTWVVLPDLLEALPVGRHPDRAVGSVYARLVVTGFLAAVVTTAALSVVVLALVPTGDRARATAVLIAMAAVTLVGFSGSVLQAMGAESAVAAGLVVCGCLAIGATALGSPLAPLGLVLLVVVHLAWLPLLVHVLKDPERALAARL